MNTTPWPMKTLSSIVTPSQTKVWLEILQRLPTMAFFWISTNAPILVSSPTSHPYRLTNLESLTSLPSLTSEEMQTYSFINKPMPPAVAATELRPPTFSRPVSQRHRHSSVSHS